MGKWGKKEKKIGENSCAKNQQEEEQKKNEN